MQFPESNGCSQSWGHARCYRFHWVCPEVVLWRYALLCSVIISPAGLSLTGCQASHWNSHTAGFVYPPAAPLAPLAVVVYLDDSVERRSLEAQFSRYLNQSFTDTGLIDYPKYDYSFAIPGYAVWKGPLERSVEADVSKVSAVLMIQFSSLPIQYPSAGGDRDFGYTMSDWGRRYNTLTPEQYQLAGSGWFLSAQVFVLPSMRVVWRGNYPLKLPLVNAPWQNIMSLLVKKWSDQGMIPP